MGAKVIAAADTAETTVANSVEITTETAVAIAAENMMNADRTAHRRP